MFPLTITLHDNNQLQAVINALSTNKASPCQGHAAESTKEEAKKSDVAQKAAPADTKATATAGADAAPETKVESSDAKPASSDKTYTIDDAKALTMKLVAAKGRDAAVAVLKKYDVAVAAKLAGDQIAAFCADAEQALAS